MDVQTLMTALLGIVLAGVGWWVKTIWAMVVAQQVQITTLQVELARSYMPRAELQDTLKRLFDKLDEIQREVSQRP
jgi:hypothetical protein